MHLFTFKLKNDEFSSYAVMHTDEALAKAAVAKEADTTVDNLRLTGKNGVGDVLTLGE